MIQLKKSLYLAAMVAVVAVCGCAQLGLPEAKSFNQRAAVAYGTVTAVRNTAATLLVNNKITASEGRNVFRQTEVARASLDTAVEVYPTSKSDGETKLATATEILRTLQVILQERSAQK